MTAEVPQSSFATMGSAIVSSVSPRDESGLVSQAERAAEYVIARARAASGHRFHQGRRVPPLPSGELGGALRFFAEQRLHRVPTSVARALLAWGAGFPATLCTSIPEPCYVLSLQARGERCVSLLPDGVPTGLHEDALAFALHDLCHLDKFMDPEHHLGQVGFFACFHHATLDTRFIEFVAPVDEAFQKDLDHVGSDMNGSAVFLFAALKMKLKMAVRRRCGKDTGVPPLEGGVLTTEESTASRRRSPSCSR